MKTYFYTAVAIAGTALGASAATTEGSTGYLLSTDGQSIVVIDDLAAPTDQREVELLGGTVEGLSYRPVTGELYGYSTGNGAYGATSCLSSMSKAAF